MKIVINTDELKNYRIVNVDFIRQLSMASGSISRINQQANNPELAKALRAIQGALINCDFADKFVMVHGTPKKQKPDWDVTRASLIHQISNKPLGWMPELRNGGL